MSISLQADPTLSQGYILVNGATAAIFNASGTLSATNIVAGSVTNIFTSNYTLQDSDCNSILYFNSTSPLSAILPNPNTVRNGYQITIIQANTGTLYINSNGNTFNQAYQLYRTATRWSAATLTYSTTFGWTLFGDLA